MVDYSQFEHAVIGEKYYIVHCTKSRYIQLVYPTKAYELK